MDKPMLGDYRIEGIVGVGRMGVVYLAIDRISGRAVALKVLREDAERNGELYIATRLVSATLRDAILAAPVSLDFGMDVLSRIASALDTAHAAGIVHRDVKPANVLLDPGPEVYLADFGIARAPDGLALTAPGQALGTIDYLAPELLDGDRGGPATDIYGLSALAVEMLTGTVPYPRDTEAATLYAHVADPLPRVSDRRPELAPLDEVLAAGMAKDPDERPPTAGALVMDMLAALGRPAPACLVPAA